MQQRHLLSKTQYLNFLSFIETKKDFVYISKLTFFILSIFYLNWELKLTNMNLCFYFLLHFSFMNTRFISLKVLNEAALPLYPEDFENFVKQKCLEQRDLLEKNWIPRCAKLILELKDFWRHLVPLAEDEVLDLPMKFFACIAVEMSNQLRNLVVDSLSELVDFFEQYQVNEYIKF